MFIVLEGIDGSGKTTQCARLTSYMAGKLGQDAVVATREPGGWEGGDALGKFAIGGDLCCGWSRVMLFLADRCEHVARVIAPSLEAGRIVLCDRYEASTLAYQVYGDPSMPEGSAGRFAAMSAAMGFPRPDAVLLLDISAEDAEVRLSARGGKDAFDASGKDFFERVRSGYLRQMESGKGGWILINAARSEDEVFSEIVLFIDKLLGNWAVRV
ncbi:MAG: dTMP kinase [Synergistaceae bacterium]|jgi:dTMP kinase|nr:dTMP kinase [Synergistaceae bacterium]